MSESARQGDFGRDGGAAPETRGAGDVTPDTRGPESSPGAAFAGTAWARDRAGQVLLIAGHTWKEGLRRRMILVGLLLTAAFVALYGVGVYYAFRDIAGMMGGPQSGATSLGAVTIDQNMIRDLAAYQTLSFGLFISSFLSAMLVIFLASGMISGEAENGTLQTIVTRPIARVQIFLGRYLGYAGIYLAYLLLLVGGLLLLTRVFSGYAPPAPVDAVVLLALQGLIVLALVALGSTVLSPIATGILVLMAYGLAFIGGVVQQIGIFLSNGTAGHIGGAVRYLLPSDAFFRMALHGLAPVSSVLPFNIGPFGSPAPPTMGMVLYGVAYLVACLAAGAYLFERRDI